MKQISYITLQKKYGGMWVALTRGQERVVAAHKEYEKLVKSLQEKKKDLTNVVFYKVDKLGTVAVY